jgi:putative nucleotidyltransferase with HDIG domain
MSPESNTAPKRFGSLSRSAQAYVIFVVIGGASTVVHAIYELFSQAPKPDWVILALLTLISGSATVRFPALPATFSVSETFVVTSVLLFGAAAGTITVTLDALVISLWAYYRKRQPFYKSFFNVCALPLSVSIAAHLFFRISEVDPGGLSSDAAINISLQQILVPLIIFTVAYFGLNSGIIAIAIALEKRLSAFRIWRENFVLLSLNYFGGASVAILLVTYTRHLDFTYLAVIVPFLFILYFTFSTSMGRVEDANRHLTQLNALYMSTIETLAMAIDAKDQITHGHIRRVQTYAVGLARKMGVTDEAVLRAVEAAALLHDMGKLAVPEYILNKPGPLTAAEFEKMKLHASVGADILSAIDFPYPVVPIVRYHHESWDGSGYPEGLSGSAIPIGARILAVVDCFDALTSDRPYRPRLSDHDAIRILFERRGTMYDPAVVDTFIATHRELAPSTDAKEQSPLRAIAASASLPGRAASRLEEIAGTSEEVMTLFELARGLRAESEPSELCECIFGHARRLVPFSLCVFFVYEEASDEIVAAYVSGDSAPLVLGTRIALGQRVSGWVAAHRQPIRNADPALDLGTAVRMMPARPKSSLSAPVATGKNLIGVLTLYSTQAAAFTEEHERILQAISGQTAQALKDAFIRASRAKRYDAISSAVPAGSITKIRGLVTPTTVVFVKVEDLTAGVSDPANISSRRTIRDRLVLYLRAGDEILELPDGFAVVLPGTTPAEAERLGTQVRNCSVPESESRLTTTAVVSPHDGASVADLIEIARQRSFQSGSSDAVH